MTLGTSTQAYWEPSYWDERYIKYSDALRLVPKLCRPCFSLPAVRLPPASRPAAIFEGKPLPSWSSQHKGHARRR